MKKDQHMDADEILDDPQFKAWAKDVRDNLLPKVEKSAYAMTLVPRGDTDIKFAVELGVSIMMDKPILAITHPGVRIPEKLRLVADEIVEVDLTSAHDSAGRELAAQALKAAADRITARLAL